MSSSTKGQAFSFDTEFGERGEVLRDGMDAYKRYRKDELDAACAKAREDGIRSVEAETERRIAASADAMMVSLAPVLPFARTLAENMRREAAELALHTARKIAGAALDHFPEAAIEASLTEMLSHLPEGAKLTLSVQPDLAERLEAAIRPRLGADFDLTVYPDPRTRPGAWKVTWESGGFSHDPEALAARIETLISEHLKHPVEDQSDLFADIA